MHSKDFTYLYDNQKIPYRIWFSDSADKVETVIFLGTVQIGKMPGWVAEQCPPKTAVVQGAPHWHARADGSDIAEFMFGFTCNAFDSLLASKYVVSLRIIADSQAVPGVVSLFALDKYSGYLQNIALLQPLGFTKSIFDGTNKQQMAIFKKRVLWNSYHQIPALLSDGRLRYNHCTLSRIVNLDSEKAAAQYSSGLSYDALSDLQKLYAINQNIVIVCGAHDEIFPPREIEASLQAAQIQVQVVIVKNVPHSPLATKLGSKLLAHAFELQSDEQKS